MQRALGILIATFAISSLSGTPAVARSGTPSERSTGDEYAQRGAPIDVAALLVAARGAPPVICSLASRAIQGYGWNRTDAPATPLGSFASSTSYDFDRQLPLPDADVQRLLAG
ncbi:MAG: hypothetical protein ACRENC_06625, partial [Gemmatimonadaceae bacterium]